MTESRLFGLLFCFTLVANNLYEFSLFEFIQENTAVIGLT